MKVRNKGKVHPSPSSTVSPRSPTDAIFSVLNLLPAAILILVSVLPIEDREVLAYMITRSLKLANQSLQIDGKKKNTDKKKPAATTLTHQNKTHAFDCECFDCYTSYWFKWDSSSNRELIHQAIEAFEEHLNNGELLSKNNRGKKREKATRRHLAGKSVLSPEITLPEKESVVMPEIESQFVPVLPDKIKEDAEVMLPNNVQPAQIVPTPAAIDDKGLARKVLPDFMGLLNSRLWNLWSPNV